MSTSPDIFLSYSREDAVFARRFADGFEREGLSVWWDATLRSGEAYDQVTEKALKEAKAVVVLWSRHSVESRWVRAEATLADRNKTLVPSMIEACDRPIMFELTHTADLSSWKGDAGDATWLAFVSDVRRFVEARGGIVPPPVARPPAAPAAQVGVSIVVLPFANMSGDAEQEYFADGISEDIITDLSKVSALAVISRNSAFTFKGKHVDLPQVAKQLNVTHVLEGSVRKAGNRVRVTAQLIHGATNNHLWAERYDRDLADIFALQDEISQAIVKALKLKLFAEEKQAMEQRGTRNLQAYDLYLRAKAALQTTASEQGRADKLLREALALDPDFAEARGELVAAKAIELIYRPNENDLLLQEIEEITNEALRLAPNHWASHMATAIVKYRRGDLLGAGAAYAKVAALASPSDSTAHFFLCNFLGSVGRATDAVQASRMGCRADPLSLAISGQLQHDLYLCGRVEEARLEYIRARDLVGNREVSEHVELLCVWDTEDLGATRTQFRRYLKARVYPMPLSDEVFELLDRPADARAALRRGYDDPQYQNSTHMMILSWYAAKLGDVDLAMRALRRCYVDMRGSHLKPIWFPIMKDVRRTSAFKQFVRDLGLYDYWRASGNWGEFARPVGNDDFEIHG